MNKILFGLLIGFPLSIAYAQSDFTVNAKDGDGNKKIITVKVKYDDENKKEIDQKRIESLIDKTSIRIKSGLKNEYSYVPRSAMISQQGLSFLVNLKYTAENSYGANVVNTFGQNFVMKEDGSF